MRAYKDLKIAVAGTGYVGLSMATVSIQPLFCLFEH